MSIAAAFAARSKGIRWQNRTEIPVGKGKNLPLGPFGTDGKAAVRKPRNQGLERMSDVPDVAWERDPRAPPRIQNLIRIDHP